MTYRKIIQLSPTTKVVTLPTEWLSKNKVRKGDSVSVEENGNQIIIETTKSNSDLFYSDLTLLTDDLLWNVVDAFYVLGYSNMQLKVSTSQKILLNKIVKHFPMFIIASETKTIIELRAVADKLNMDFDKTLQHIKHITCNMVDEALILIEKKDWEGLNKIKKLDYTLNSYISMCFRQLNSGIIKNAVAWAQYVKIVEVYADRLCILFEHISQLKTVVKSDIDTIKKINELYTDSFKLLNNFSIKNVNMHDANRMSLESSFVKSPLRDNFKELTRYLFDIQEIIFQLRQPM